MTEQVSYDGQAMAYARSLLAESLQVLLIAHDWNPADLSRAMGKGRSWAYRLVAPNKNNERGTTLTTLDEICQVFNRQLKIQIETSDLFAPETIRAKLQSKISLNGSPPMTSAGTPAAYTPDNPAREFVDDGTASRDFQRLEARFVHLESIMFDCYATLARYYAPGESRHTGDDGGAQVSQSKAAGSSRASRRARKTSR
jgi:hypothetical protein